MQTKIYNSASSRLKVSNIVKEMFVDLIKSKDLAWRLTVRDIKAQYRQSILGIFWAFIIPLVNTIVWIFLNSSGIIKIADTGIPYPVYVFTGTTLWAILVESINMPLLQTNASKEIIAKINFPKEALLLSGMYKIVFNTSIALAILLPALLLMGVFPTVQLLFFPVVFIAIVLLGVTIGTFITPVGMLFKDIEKIIPILLQLLMYFSPVVYTAKGAGIFSTIIKINPLSILISTGRSALTGLPFENITYFFILLAIALVVLFFTWFLFRVSIPIIAERISS